MEQQRREIIAVVEGTIKLASTYPVGQKDELLGKTSRIIQIVKQDMLNEADDLYKRPIGKNPFERKDYSDL